MCEKQLMLNVVIVILCIFLKGFIAVDDKILWVKESGIRGSFEGLRSPIPLLDLSDNTEGILFQGMNNMPSQYILSGMIFCSLSPLFTVTRAPRYFGILQDHRGQPLSVEISEEYMDQDYIATNRRRHKIDWNKTPLDMDDFDDDDTEETFDEKDKDVKLPNKFNLQGPV